LDSIGTVFISFLAGPWVGAVTAAITSLLTSGLAPENLAFAPVGILIAVVIGILTRYKMGSIVVKIIVCALVLVAATVISSTVITIIVYGGTTPNATGIEIVETTEDEQKRYSIKRGDVFFTRTSETKEEIGKTSVLLDDVEKGVFSGFVLRARPITELLLPEYCAYCFETYEFRKNVIRYSTYTTRALTNGTTLSNLEIPVPPIEIQNKIVKILDRFQELLSDTKGLLPLEIEQRRKQYEYYREKLLTFDVECSSTHARTHVDNI